MIMSQNAVADEIEIPVTQPVLSLVSSPVHGLLRRCVQGAENRTLEPVTSIRLKIEESWYASMDCKVQKSGPWVCFYGGHSTGYKLGHHPKNIEPCAHRARTVRAPCAHRATTPPYGHNSILGAPKRAVLLTIGCGISCSSFLSLATFAENARSPGKLRFIAILGVFRLETAVASRVTKMAITRF